MRAAMPIQPVEKDLLYIKVAEAIRKHIKNNQLSSGDKLPSERELAVQLMTSRNCVREALRVLENEGVIAVRTGKGAFVTEGGEQHSLCLKPFRVNYFELLEIKTLLEREVILRAVQHATPEKLLELDGILSVVEQQAARGIYDEAQDQRFHIALLKLANNKMMEQMVGNLIRELSNFAPLIQDPVEIFISTIPYHRRMLEAIKLHDAQAACDAYGKIMEIDLTALR